MKTTGVLRRSVQFARLGLFAGLLMVVLLSVVPASAAIGSSSFAPKLDFATGAGPHGSAIGDIDGDGWLDLAVSNYGSVNSTIGNTVSVLRNKSMSGSVEFDPKVDFTTEDGPTEVALGDIDGDGKPDMVTANYGAFSGGTTVSVLRNTSTSGSVSFAARVNFTTEQGPTSLAIADIDGDTKPDLVVTNYNNGQGTTVSVLRNTSTSGSVSFATRVNFTTGTGPYGVTIGDIDGDGKPDLVVANTGVWNVGDGTTISVLRNTSTSGNVSFEPKVDFTTGAGPRYIAIGDLDGDGKSDVMASNFGATGGTTISVFRNTSTSGNVSFEPKMDFTTGTGPIRLVISDIDRDGKSDAVVANYSDDTVSVLENTSTIGNISFAPKVDFVTEAGPHGLEIGDLDGDSWLDLTTANYGSDTISVLRKIPSLIVTKRAVNEGGNPLHPGERITYTVTISNADSITDTNVVVSDAFPAYTNFVADSITITPSSVGGTPGTPDTQPVIASGITMTAKSLITVTYAVTINPSLPDQTVITNTASVTSTEMASPVGDTITDTVSSAPVLTINKSSQDANGETLMSGDTLTYTLVVANDGTDTATGGLISDNVPANTTFVPGSITLDPSSAGTKGTSPPTLASNLAIAAGDRVTVTFAVKVDSPLPNGTQIQNSASVTSNEITIPVEDSVTDTVSNAPILTIDKSSQDTNGGTLMPGDTLMYTLVVANDGTDIATGGVISDNVPANTTFVPGSITLDPSNAGTKGTSPPTLASNLAIAAGDRVTVTFAVKVDLPLPNGTQIQNSASVTSNEVTIPVEDSVTDTVSSLPVLSIEKSSLDMDGGDLKPGDTISYTIVVANNGTANATGGVILGSLPADTSFVADSIKLKPVSAGVAGIVPPILASELTIGANQSVTVSYAVVVHSPLPDQTQIVNTMAVSSDQISIPLTDVVIDIITSKQHIFLPLVIKNGGS